ncbi:MAG TPA: polysaccharide deacetylase family protein [Vicinamibacterales bacterium]
MTITQLQVRARRLGAGLYYGSLRALRIPALRRRRPGAAVILCYHNVVAADDDSTGAPGLHIRRDRFEQQVRWLADHYAVVPLSELIRPHSARTSRPLAAITFDDGYAGVFEHAVPLLGRLGIPATVFVVAGAPGRPAGGVPTAHACAVGCPGFWWDQPGVIRMLTPALRDLWLHRLRGDTAAILSEAQDSRVAPLPPACRPADWATIRAHASRGMEIGVHSATHRCLTTLTDRELEYEIEASRTVIHAETGIWPEFFSYPYGLSDARVRAAVREAGYRAAVGLEGCVSGSAVDRWALPRVPVPSEISESAFEAWTAGLHGCFAD